MERLHIEPLPKNQQPIEKRISMSNLFKKAIVFTDIHLGQKSNSALHNKDCEDFVDWMIGVGKREGCETCIFPGDWHHHRNSVNLQTLSTGIRILEKISKNFDHVYMIPGNHDLYFKDKRDVHGTEWAKHLPNVTVLNTIHKEGDCIFVPWLVGEEYKQIIDAEAKYMFGHFELPHFKMNAMVVMPDHGNLKQSHFSNIEKVFSGHFHLRQKQKNIHYIGNAFPHNFSDAGDDQRGCMVLEWGEEEKFYAWPDQPLYNVYNLSHLIDNADTLLKPKMHVKVPIDVELSYEEANYIKETFLEKYQLRELALVANRSVESVEDGSPDQVHFESVDQIITEQITNISSESYDPNLLLEIYNTL